MQIKTNSFLALIVFLCASTSLFAQRKDISKLIEERVKIVDGQRSFNTHGVTYNHGKAPQVNSRDEHFSSTLVDYSKNGLGAYVGTTNPLAYGVDEGYFIVYRQYIEGITTHGFIGAAQSVDGENWEQFQMLNTSYPNGDEWDPEAGETLPTNGGEPQGRFPSAGFVEGGKPTAIWNEYTLPTHGGGSYGGYPLYAFNALGMGVDAYWSDPYTSNTGCNSIPCDSPADLWNGNAMMIKEGSSSKFLGIYGDWGETHRDIYYMLTSRVNSSGYLSMNPPSVIADGHEGIADDDTLWSHYSDGGGAMSDPDWHINADGVGYLVQLAYGHLEDYGGNMDDVDLLTYVNPNFFIKKTEDFGESWTSVGGFKGSGYHVITDQVELRLTDSLFTVWTEEENEYYYHYGDSLIQEADTLADGTIIPEFNYLMTPGWDLSFTFEMRTDAGGGLHIVFPSGRWACKDVDYGCEDRDDPPDGWADSLYYSTDLGGSGIWHIYSPDPMSGVDNWTGSFIFDMSEDYSADWFASDIATIVHDGGDYEDYRTMQYFYPNITMSAESENVMWFSISGMSDYGYSADSTIIPLDVDLYMAKSTDNGHHWSEVENVTNTPTTGETFTNMFGYPIEAALESGVHLANQGMDESVGVFYQMMDPNVVTIPDAGYGYESHKMSVYVGIYENEWEYEDTTSVGIDKDLTPKDFTLNQNYPNPFNPITQIQYEMKSAGQVNMELFDIRGAKVRTLINENKPAGSYEFTFDGPQLSSGVYFYSMTANGITKTRKLVLMK